MRMGQFNSARVSGDFEILSWSPLSTSLAEATGEAREVAEAAAKQGFNVTRAEILTKMADSTEILNFYTKNGRLAAFGCVIGPMTATLNGEAVTFTYANGLIVHPDFARQGISRLYFQVISEKADVVLGNTQHPFVVKGLRTVFPNSWPTADHVALTPEAADFFGECLRSVGRPQTFDPKTGVVKNLYPGPLYGQDEHDVTGDGTKVKGGDGIVILGFQNSQIYLEAVERATTSINWSPQPLSFNFETAPTPTDRLDSIVIGAGHAGQDLHLPCIKKAAASDSLSPVSGRVAVVERNALVETRSSLPRFSDIAAVDFEPATTVVHVTTGPGDRVEALRQAAAQGFKFFILEKPLVAAQAQLDELRDIVRENDLEVVVNLPWIGTPLTRRVKTIIDSKIHGSLATLSMIQTKPRSAQRQEAIGCTSAWDIEAPHQVSLAVHLAGDATEILHANCSPLVGESAVIPFMGGASLLLQHGSTSSSLHSDLDRRERVRKIQLVFEDGWRCVGHYPPDGTDGSQDLSQYDKNRCCRQQEKFFDDPLTSLFKESYRYFLKTGPLPDANFQLALTTTELISAAKIKCGVEIESLI